jgi:hypothetical protein
MEALIFGALWPADLRRERAGHGALQERAVRADRGGGGGGAAGCGHGRVRVPDADM